MSNIKCYIINIFSQFIQSNFYLLYFIEKNKQTKKQYKSQFLSNTLKKNYI